MSAHLKAKMNLSRKTTPRVNMFWEFPGVQEILAVCFILACEQAVCLGKGWKKLRFPQTESLFTG